MSFAIQRPYRESVKLPGFLRLINQEFPITVKNISITGVLVELQSKKDSEEYLKDIFSALHVSTLVDFFIPALQMAVEAQLVRADIDSENLLLGLEFNEVHHHAKGFIFRITGEVIE